MESTTDIGVCVLGASPDTGNLGVSALAETIISGVAREKPRSRLTVFDNGWGLRPASATVNDRSFGYYRCGLRRSKRYYRRESMFNVRLSAELGGLGNPAARAIRRADVVLDVSGGDSFSDIYGQDRFKAITQVKELVLRQRRSLVFLPQTYGPFATAGARQTAEKILRAASAAWARDPDSFEAMCELLGDRVDSDRHRLGVDMAFALEPTPVGHLDLDLSSDRPLAGLNVSGLLFNDVEASRHYGLGVDYRAATLNLLKLLIGAGARVLLVPHVHSIADYAHSDRKASESILAELDPSERERVTVLADGLSAGETKWAIGHCDWFCGTRMHSTIAALSSSVPAAAIAYSAKTAGVFAECGQRDHVADARSLSTQDAIETLWESWLQRDRTRAALGLRVPEVVGRAKAQWGEILNGAIARS